MLVRFIIVCFCLQALIGCERFANTTRGPVDAPPELGAEGSSFADLPEPTVSREQAIQIALCEMHADDMDPESRFLRATQRIHDDRSQWRVGYSNPLGGGWNVQIDAYSGEVLTSRILPAR